LPAKNNIRAIKTNTIKTKLLDLASDVFIPPIIPATSIINPTTIIIPKIKAMIGMEAKRNQSRKTFAGCADKYMIRHGIPKQTRDKIRFIFQFLIISNKYVK